jgi:hypothetical protein
VGCCQFVAIPFQCFSSIKQIADIYLQLTKGFSCCKQRKVENNRGFILIQNVVSRKLCFGFQINSTRGGRFTASVSKFRGDFLNKFLEQNLEKNDNFVKLPQWGKLRLSRSRLLNWKILRLKVFIYSLAFAAWQNLILHCRFRSRSRWSRAEEPR